MASVDIAVVGSGISGLSAAWLLSRGHNVTLYERGARLGGHSNTVEVATQAGPVAVDTGFIVYNEKTYPNLTALFRHLGVKTQPTQMTFALSLAGGRYEYGGSGFNGLFGQRSNLFRPGHWRLLRDVLRFFASAQARAAALESDVTLGEFLAGEGYGKRFASDHIIPMGAAIWSTPAKHMLDFPARSFIDFYTNHGMLQVKGRPPWRTVSGGSREYVARIVADGNFRVLPHDVRRVSRRGGRIVIADAGGSERSFDQAVIATHADDALALLDEASRRERELLGAMRYASNRAVLHRDARLMPKRRRLWASWNYLKRGRGNEVDLCVSYWMNSLQGLCSPQEHFVTLNPYLEIDPSLVDGAFDYEHPMFDARALDAQRQLWSLQGRGGIWYCGSYFGHGFHEDGLQSGLAVAEQLGGIRRPWTVANETGRISAVRPATMLEAAE